MSSTITMIITLDEQEMKKHKRVKIKPRVFLT